MTHICVSELTIIGSDNGLSPGRRQAIIQNNARLLLIEPLGTNFSEISIGIPNIFIQENALEHVVCEMASILSRPQCFNSVFHMDWWRPSSACCGHTSNISLGGGDGCDTVIRSGDYRKVSNIRRTKLKCFSSHLAAVFVQSIVARC